MTDFVYYITVSATILLAVIGIAGWARVYDLSNPDAKKK